MYCLQTLARNVTSSDIGVTGVKVRLRKRILKLYSCFSNDVLKLENEKRQLMAKLKQSKNREEILEMEKENAIKEGVTTKERIKGTILIESFLFLLDSIGFHFT